MKISDTGRSESSSMTMDVRMVDEPARSRSRTMASRKPTTSASAMRPPRATRLERALAAPTVISVEAARMPSREMSAEADAVFAMARIAAGLSWPESSRSSGMWSNRTRARPPRASRTSLPRRRLAGTMVAS
jgi:hypothetical protein